MAFSDRRAGSASGGVLRPSRRVGGRGGLLVGAVLTVLGLVAPAAQAWELARVEPQVDNLEELLHGCQRRRERALERSRQVADWAAYKEARGEDASAERATVADVPACGRELLMARLAGRAPAVSAMSASDGGDLLFATVNLPLPALLVSADGGLSWRYRHLFARGYNVDEAVFLRGLDYRHGVLAVASQDGVLLSDDGGHSFVTTLEGRPFSAIAISPRDKDWMVAGGEGTGFVSTDGGCTWRDLGFSTFILGMSDNPYRSDHITSLQVDPLEPSTVYVGTGSHLYRWVATGGAGSASLGSGRWQVMAGDGAGRVLDDSTVYNVEIGSRFMISTCNGVYYLARKAGGDGDRADVSWRKFRDKTFANRGVGGPKGNLRAYFVSEDPADPGRILVADFAGLYEGRSDGGEVRWKRVEGLPYYAPGLGYPEYTTIAWNRQGGAVVGSRYRGIYVQRPAAPARDASPGPSCVLR